MLNMYFRHIFIVHEGVRDVTLEGYLLCIEVAIAILLILGRSMKH